MEENQNTKDFLEKYCKKHDVTEDEAKEHKIVQNVSSYYDERDASVVSK